MTGQQDYTSYSLPELYHLAHDVDEASQPERYDEIKREIERREALQPPRKANGSTILALGIVGLVLTFVIGILGLIVALIAWSMGDTALKQLDSAESVDPVERNNAYIGRTCGMIAALVFLGQLILVWLTKS